MLRLVAFLLCSAIGVVPAWAATYYVSKTATNGYVVGADGNAGTTKGTAKATISNAITTAADGDTIVVNDGTYSNLDLGASNYVDFNAKAINFQPETAYGVILNTDSASNIVMRFRNDNTTPLTVGKIILDCEKPSSPGTYIATGVQIDNPTNAVVHAFAGTKIGNCSTQNIADNAQRGTLTVDAIFFGKMKDGLQGSTAMASAAAKTYTITSLVLDDVISTDTFASVAISATRSSVSANPFTFSVTSLTGSLTAPSSLGTTATGTLINIVGIFGASIEGVNATVNGASTTNSCYGINITNSALGAAAKADNPLVRYNTVTMNCPAGYAIIAGDSTIAYNVDYAQIYANTVYMPFYNGVSTPHGIVLGRVAGGLAWGNTVYGGAVGYMTSINQGGIITGNLAIGSYYAPLFSKGSGATTAPLLINNTVIMDDTLYGAKFGPYGCQGVAAQGATNNAAATFANNICAVRSGNDWKYAVVDASQVATFDRSNYHSVPTLTSPWSYQGTTYTTVGLWNAAATVGDETNNNPLFVAESDYRLRAYSTLRRAGKWTTIGCKDFRGRPCYQPIDVGAYQTSSGDPAGTRLTR